MERYSKADSEAPYFYPHLYADYEEKMLYAAYENTGNHKLLKISFNELGV